MDSSLLSSTPANPPLRVLVLDEELPWPLDSGKRIRTWHLLTQLAQRHRITLAAYGRADSAAARIIAQADIEFVPVAPRRCETGLGLYARLAASLASRDPFSVSKHYRRRFQRTVNRLLASQAFDLIHCEWTPYAQFVTARDGKTPPVLIATHNIEADILARRAATRSSTLPRLFFTSQARRMEHFERRVFSSADAVTTVSEPDRECAMTWGARRAMVVANGVDTDGIQPGAEAGRPGEILFLGSLDWFANIDAVEFFVREVLPLIRRLEPSAHLQVVGRRPGGDLRKMLAGAEGATLVGEVDDTRPWLQRAAVVAVPLRIGGGTRIKILEAMAAGKIVVSTTIGAEGLEVIPGEHLLVADTPEDISQAIQRVLRRENVDRIPAQARACVEERYSWRLQAARLEQAWLQASGR